MGNICNTLDPRDRFQNMPFYWSGIGHSDPNAPEMLIYELRSDLCVITEINIQPFKVFFHPGKPIYSAKSVRFRLGHLNSSRDESDLLQLSQQQPVDDEFIWMYTSEEFPTRQGRRTSCSGLSYQNRCFVLVDICRLNCWAELRDVTSTVYFTYALAM